MQFYYGTKYILHDVSTIIKDKFTKNDTITIPINTIFNEYFGDVVFGEIKSLFIKIDNELKSISEIDILKSGYKIDKKGNIEKINTNLSLNKIKYPYKLFNKEIYKEIAFITLTNWGYKEYTDNLLLSLKYNDLLQYIKIYCIDDKAYQYFKNKYKNNNVYLVKDNNLEEKENFVSYYMKNWNIIMYIKLKIIYNLLSNYKYVFYTDGDIVFNNFNTINYLLSNIDENDIIIQDDTYGQTNILGNLEFCAGFMFIKSSEIIKNIFNTNNIDLSKFSEDQQYLNSKRDKFKFKLLPNELFPNGKYYYDHHSQLDPFIIHFNFTVGHEKKNLMKKYNKWYLNRVMKFKEWVNYENIDPKEIIINNSPKDGSSKFQEKLPIGAMYILRNYIYSHPLKNYICCKQINSKLVHQNFKIDTDTHRPACQLPRGPINRKIIADILKDKNFIDKGSFNKTEFFDKIGEYKFVISPEGNGYDCHRHYETWLSKGIPIIEKNPLIEKKYEGLPILWTTDYSELTEEYLNKKFEEFQDQVFDFNKLFKSFYSNNEIKIMEDRGEYWYILHTPINNRIDLNSLKKFGTE